MSLLAACVSRIDDPAESLANLRLDTFTHRPPRSKSGNSSDLIDGDISMSISSDKYETEFADKILTHALKLKKKCKALKVTKIYDIHYNTFTSISFQ